MILDDKQVYELLERAHVVAIVGLSPEEGKASNGVARYLKREGYRIIPVNPKITEALGEKAYPSLAEIPVPVDVVQIFRRSEDVPPVVEDAIAIGAKVVWMQSGIINEEAAARAEAAGLKVVMDACMREEHRAL